MKQNTRVVQISGFRGLMMVIFFTSCLAAGFIAFPSLVAMNIWNFAAKYVPIPLISIWQGLMLWAIVTILVLIINDRKKYVVAFSSKDRLSDEEIKALLNTIRIQSRHLNSMADPVNKMEHTEKNEKEKI